MIKLLNLYQSDPRDSLPWQMLFAQAGLLLEADQIHIPALITSLNLINAEEYLPSSIRRGELSAEFLQKQLLNFLRQYCLYQPLVEEVIKD